MINLFYLGSREVKFKGNTLYESLLNSTCFIASLSDGKALEIAKNISSN